MTVLLRRARPCVLSDESGFTLIEALVTMLIVTMLSGAMMVSLSNLGHTTITTTSRVRAAQQATTVIDRLTKAIRTAAPPVGGVNVITYADTKLLTLFDDYTDPNGPRKISFYTSGGPLNAQLREDATLADSSGAYSGSPSSKIDSTDLNLSGGGIFTYFTAAGTVIPTPISTPAGIASIASIGILLTTQEPGISAPVTTTTRVYIRNVEYH